MKHKNILKILLVLIVVLLLFLLITNEIKEDFINVSKTENTESELLEPILRLLYSDEIKYVDSKENVDLQVINRDIPTNSKPYILINQEPNLRQFENKLNGQVHMNSVSWIGADESKSYFQALKDPYCVACFVTSLDYTDKDKTFYVPNFLNRGNFTYKQSPFIRKYTNPDRQLLAAYIATHSPPHRHEFFKQLRALDLNVDGLGKANHTKDVALPSRDVWWNLSEVYSNYKFGFAMENMDEYGYITEKIMNVYVGGAIPLYWGTSLIKTIFNTESFVYLNDFSSLKEAAAYVYELSKDFERMEKMRNAPIFVADSPYEQYWNIPAPQWVVDIANKIKENVDKI